MENNFNYLKSELALKDFAKIRMNSDTASKFKKAWMKHLEAKAPEEVEKVKMGITNPTVLIPAGTVDYIENNIIVRGIWGRITKFANTKILTRTFDTSTDSAHAHVRDQAKLDQTQTLNTLSVVLGTIYKYTTFNQIDEILSPAYVEYIYRELPLKVMQAVEQQIIWGFLPDDVTPSGNANAFLVPIDTDTITTTYTPATGVTEFTQLETVINNLTRNEGVPLSDIVVVADAEFSTALGNAMHTTATQALFVANDRFIAETFGIAEYITLPKQFSTSTTRALVGNPMDYHVGLMRGEVETLSDFDISYNKRRVESMIHITGMLTKPTWTKILPSA
jgi:hypothetical protein